MDPAAPKDDTMTRTDLLAAASDSRRESLTLAIELGADDATLATLAAAPRLARRNYIQMAGSWARNASGRFADRDGAQVTLTAGTWTVMTWGPGAVRKETRTQWVVTIIEVGDQCWTIARRA